MSEPDDAALVAELRAKLDAATPGPWMIYHGGALRSIYADMSGRWRGEKPVSSWSQRVAGADPLREKPDADAEAVANAALIVAAVNALPQLLTALEASRQRVGVLEGALKRIGAMQITANTFSAAQSTFDVARYIAHVALEASHV